MPACRIGFASSFRPNVTKARPRAQVRCDVGRVQLRGDGEVLDRLFESSCLPEGVYSRARNGRESPVGFWRPSV